MNKIETANERIINLGILAHVDAGKTTLTEQLLCVSGVKQTAGRVDDGNTTTDSMKLERERGMTIRSTTVSFNYNGVKINLYDTPGHLDFVAEVNRSLMALGGAVLVVSAREGVQPQTKALYEKLSRMNIPTIIFINKLDRIGADVKKVCDELNTLTQNRCVFMQDADIDLDSAEISLHDIALDSDENREKLLYSSDTLMTRWLNSEKICAADYNRVLSYAVKKAKLFPIYMGTALKGIGITELLNAMTQFFADNVKNVHTELSGLVYKTEIDEKGTKRAYIRLYDGEIKLRASLNINNEKTQIRSLYTLEDGKMCPTESVNAPDVCVVANNEDLICGGTLGRKPRVLSKIKQDVPMLSVSVMPVEQHERAKLIHALKELNYEDPSLALSVDEITNEIKLRLFGKLQTEVIKEILAERYCIDAVFSEVKTLFMLRPESKATAVINMCGDNLHLHAAIELQLAPLQEDSGIEYETKVDIGFLTRSFQTAVHDGVMLGLATYNENGVTDVKATLTWADYDSVMSTPSDYRRLAPYVVKKALDQVRMIKLEPIQRYLLRIPSEYKRRIMSDLMLRRAVMESIEERGGETIINGRIPLDESKGYLPELLAHTSGRGFFEQSFLRYSDKV